MRLASRFRNIRRIRQRGMAGLASVEELTSAVRDNALVLDLRKPGQERTSSNALNFAFDKTNVDTWDIDGIVKAARADKTAPLIIH